MSKVTLYFSSVSASMELKKRQSRITDVLGSLKYQYEVVDIASDTSAKEKMRELASDPTARPPQIANGDNYCGNYDAFDDAVESETLKEFLKI